MFARRSVASVPPLPHRPIPVYPTVLGARLRECVGTVLAAGERTGRSAHDIFGSPDDLKFRSCLTLFEAAAEGEDKALFAAALAQFYDGIRDPLTLDLLGR